MDKGCIPLAGYEDLVSSFNPLKFDGETWAQLAQDAGIKYLSPLSFAWKWRTIRNEKRSQETAST